MDSINRYYIVTFNIIDEIHQYDNDALKNSTKSANTKTHSTNTANMQHHSHSTIEINTT